MYEIRDRSVEWGSSRITDLINYLDLDIVSILDARALRGARYHRPVLDALPSCPLTQQIEDVWRFILSVKDEQYFYQ